MKILQVLEACGAGTGLHLRVLCEELAASGHHVTVAYSPLRTDKAFEQFMNDWQDTIRFVPIEVGREVSPVSDLRGFMALLRLIRRGGPYDVIHAHSSKAGAIARAAGRLLGVPTVYTPHSLIVASPEISRLEGVVYELVERVLGHWATSRMIAVSEDEREFVREHRLVPSNRIAVIPNGVDDRDVQDSAERETSEDLRERPLTFGAAMRFSAQKAPMHLVEAFLLLKQWLPHLPMRLVVAGDGELFPQVKNKVEQNNADGSIVLLGWKSDVGEVLRELDIFVVSSLYEGLSYSVLEAMVAGLPVVSTDVFGVGETISRVPGNPVVPAGDPYALATGMRGMISPYQSGSLRKSLRSIGEQNREYALLHFGRDEATRRTIETYQEVSVSS